MSQEMEEKYYKVGEVFQMGFIKVKCIEGNGCVGCVFNQPDCDNSTQMIGQYAGGNRPDGKNVLFIKDDGKEG